MYGLAMSPQLQLDGFIDRFTPDVAAQARRVLARMQARLPGAVQLVYDNYNALAIGFAPLRKPSTAVMSVAIYPRGVMLYFLTGASLPDPDGLLKGSGTKGRHIPDADESMFDDAPVVALIDAAVARANPPFRSDAQGELVIQSISARQRPRRPAT